MAFFDKLKSQATAAVSGAEKISLVWHSSDEQNAISKNWRKTI